MKNLNKKFLKTAFAQEWSFRNATQKELLKLKKNIYQHIKKSQFTPVEIKEKLLKKLHLDRKLIDALNIELKKYPKEATIPLQFNKMLEILNFAIEFLEENFDNFFESLKNNQELEDYKIKTLKKDVTTMDNTGSSIYGTSKGSILKTLLLNIELIYSGKTYLSEIKPNENWLKRIISFLKECFGFKKQFWIDKTPNAQVTPLPPALDPQSVKIEGGFDFTNCTYFFNDTKTNKGLAYTHSGYAFGGYRNDPRYPYPPGKLFGPEDCSSWIGKTTLGNDEISTIDLWNRWKYEYPQQGFTVPVGWVNTPRAQVLINQYTPVKVKVPQTDIVPGLVWAMREFDIKEDPEMKQDGKAGHTVLVVKQGIDDANKVKGIGYNRDMPKIEGFGLSTFASTDQPTKRIMFFKVRPQERSRHAANEEFYTPILLPY